MAKALRFIVDESTGAAVAEYLRDAGHDVLAVAEAIPQTPDEDILARAVNDRRILVTNDKDCPPVFWHDGTMRVRRRPLEGSAPGREKR